MRLIEFSDALQSRMLTAESSLCGAANHGLESLTQDPGGVTGR
ncbi:hypothetical protein [Rathayibacter soli]|nr:hypothetical protein [Glaciibacter superstes]